MQTVGKEIDGELRHGGISNKTGMLQCFSPLSFTVCPQNYTEFEERCFKVIRNHQELSWKEAENLCKTQEGHLASITDERTMMFIYVQMLVSEGYGSEVIYIGMYYKVLLGTTISISLSLL